MPYQIPSRADAETQRNRDVFMAQVEARRDNNAGRRESERQAQGMQERAWLAEQGAVHQQNRDAQLANYEAQRQGSAAQIQQNRDVQLHQQGMQSQAQQADLQARLNATKLGQEDHMRMQRLYQSRDAIQSNPDLSDEEKRNLVTQVVSGLNPLENRQRQSQMLFQQIQSQALQQQTQQQATLFNQRQQFIARGAQASLQTLTDPDTGARRLFQVGHDGSLQEMDFSDRQEAHQVRMQQAQMGMQIQAAMAPGEYQLLQHRVQHAGMSNEDLGQQIAFNRDANPHRLNSMRIEVDSRLQGLDAARQQYRQRDQMFPLELQREQEHLNAMRQTLAHGAVMNPLVEGEAQRQAAFNQTPLQQRLTQATLPGAANPTSFLQTAPGNYVPLPSPESRGLTREQIASHYQSSAAQIHREMHEEDQALATRNAPSAANGFTGGSERHDWDTLHPHLAHLPENQRGLLLQNPQVQEMQRRWSAAQRDDVLERRIHARARLIMNAIGGEGEGLLNAAAGAVQPGVRPTGGAGALSPRPVDPGFGGEARGGEGPNPENRTNPFAGGVRGGEGPNPDPIAASAAFLQQRNPANRPGPPVGQPAAGRPRTEAEHAAAMHTLTTVGLPIWGGLARRHFTRAQAEEYLRSNREFVSPGERRAFDQ